MEIAAAGRARFTAHARRLADQALRLTDATAARQLASLGAPGVQLLVDAFPTHRLAAALVLHEILLKMRTEGTLDVLRELTFEEAGFRALLVDDLPIVRTTATRILGHSGERRWAMLLGRVLREDPDAAVRRASVDALVNLGSPDLIPSLLAAVEAPVTETGQDAVWALGRLGAGACWYLIPVAMEHRDDAIRRAAAQALARFADASVWTEVLERFQAARCWEPRKTLVEGFGRSRAPRVVPTLVRTLIDDPSPIVRQAAAEALVAVRETRAIGALYDSALYDSCTEAAFGPGVEGPCVRYPVREAAAEALLILGGPRALEDLEQIPDLQALPSGRR